MAEAELDALASAIVARIVRDHGEGASYASRMDCPFEAYESELRLRDLDPKTRERYSQIVASYGRWLAAKDPDVATAEEYIAHLRDQGYSQSSVLLYYHAIKQFLDFLGLAVPAILRKSGGATPI